MSGKRFQAKAKTVQKLGRDGLVEQNVATGEEKRVSQRTADISFGPDRAVEQAAGHRADKRGSDTAATAKKKRRKQPRPVQQRLKKAVYAVQAPAVTQEIPVPGCAPSDVLLPDTLPPEAPSMRMAVDVPLMGAVAPDTGTPSIPLVSSPLRTQSSRDKFKRKQIARHTPDAASLEDRPMRTAGDAPLQNRPPGAEQQPPVRRPHRPMEGGGRLHFELTEDAVTDFEAEQSAEAKRVVKKRQVMNHAVGAVQPEGIHQTQTPVPVEGEPDVRQQDNTQPKPKTPEPSVTPDDRAAYKKKQARRFASNAAQPAATGDRHPARLIGEGSGRLHFEQTAADGVAVADTELSEQAKQATKKRQVVDYAASATQPEDGQQAEQSGPAASGTDTRQRPGTR